MRDRLPKNAAWSAFGIGRSEFPMAAVAVAAGGNVRVGLEDNLYLGRGRLAPSNAALVEKAVSLMNLLDCSPATPALARRRARTAGGGAPHLRAAGLRLGSTMRFGRISAAFALALAGMTSGAAQ